MLIHLLLLPWTSTAYDYGKALSMSQTFYYGQQEGHLPAWNTLNWRSDCALKDGSDVGLDLTGGYHDCGDHVKFHLPLSYSLYTLALAGLQYSTTFQSQGNTSDNEWIRFTNILKWGTDYFIKCHPEPFVLYGQVGQGELDHVWWGPPEFMEMPRPSYVLNTSAPGSDLAGSVSATFALSSMIFKNINASYSAELLQHSRDLFTFATQYQGKYSVSIPDAAGFYSSGGYADEQLLGALALYWATGESQYSQYALANSQTLLGYTLTWSPCWDDASYVNIFLLWKLFPGTSTATQAQKVFQQWAEYWMTGINKTPAGLAWLTGWGSLRYPIASSFLMLLSVDSGLQTDYTLAQRYQTFAVSQMNYALGNNPYNTSYIVGYPGPKGWFPHYHHRGGHSSPDDDMFNPGVNRHVNFEMLGGPDLKDGLDDTITNFGQTEGCNDMNAGLVGLSVALVKRFGGTHLYNFPYPEAVGLEFYTNATIASSTASSAQVNTVTYAQSSWPPRDAQLSFKYFVDISPLIQQGYGIGQLTYTSYYSENGTLSGWHPWSPCMYYIQVDFARGVLYPQTTTSTQKQVQISFTGLLSGVYLRSHPDEIPIYENGVLRWGKEPSKSCSNTYNCSGCVWVAV